MSSDDAKQRAAATNESFSVAATNNKMKKKAFAKSVRNAARQVWGFKMGQMVSLLIHLGDRLGVFTALLHRDSTTAAAAAATTTSAVQFATTDELSAKLHLHRRWVMELLRGLAAARVLEYREGTDATERTYQHVPTHVKKTRTLCFVKQCGGCPFSR